MNLVRRLASWLPRHVFGLAAVSWLWVAGVEIKAWSANHEAMYVVFGALYAVGAAIFINQEVKSWGSKRRPFVSTTYHSRDHWSLQNQLQIQASQRRIRLRPRRPLNRNQFRSASTEPVVGFRVWRLSQRGDELLSLVYGSWQPGVNHARCAAHYPASFKRPLQHRAPALECGCGYWLKSSLLGSLDRAAVGLTVVGVAQGWGHVVEHEDGWRVEYASVVAICALSSAPDLVEVAQGVARRYDCLLVPELIDLAKYEAAELGR